MASRRSVAWRWEHLAAARWSSTHLPRPTSSSPCCWQAWFSREGSSPGCPRRRRNARAPSPRWSRSLESRSVCAQTFMASSQSSSRAGRSVGCISHSGRRSPRAFSALRNHLIGGLVVTLLSGAGAVTAFVLRAWPTRKVLRISAIMLSGGTALTLAGVETHAVALAFAGTVVAGVGFGASALASFGTLARIAAPGERSELLAAALVIAYLAFSLPAVAAGFASTSFGLHPTTVVYSLGVVTLGLIALPAEGLRSARLKRAGSALGS